MTESLILVLTPYEIQVVCHVLEIAMKEGAVMKESRAHRAMKRVKVKMDWIIAERKKERS